MVLCSLFKVDEGKIYLWLFFGEARRLGGSER